MTTPKDLKALSELLVTLSGGVLDIDRVADDLLSDPRMVTELARLWDLDAAKLPTGTVFEPTSVDYGRRD